MTKKIFSEVLCQLDLGIRSKSNRRTLEDEAMSHHSPHFMVGAQTHKAARVPSHTTRNHQTEGAPRLLSYNKTCTPCHENSKDR